ncbi:hypothetical protein AAMO2058_000457800 [Amorphochlora amoebiformis]
MRAVRGMATRAKGTPPNQPRVKRGRLRKKRTEAGIAKNEKILKLRQRTELSENFHYENKRKTNRIHLEFRSGKMLKKSSKEKKAVASQKKMSHDSNATLVEDIMKQGRLILFGTSYHHASYLREELESNLRSNRLLSKPSRLSPPPIPSSYVVEIGPGIFGLVIVPEEEEIYLGGILENISLVEGSTISALSRAICERITAALDENPSLRWELSSLNMDEIHNPGGKSPLFGRRTRLLHEKISENVRKSFRWAYKRLVREENKRGGGGGEGIGGGEGENVLLVEYFLLSLETAVLSIRTRPLRAIKSGEKIKFSAKLKGGGITEWGGEMGVHETTESILFLGATSQSFSLPLLPPPPKEGTPQEERGGLEVVCVVKDEFRDIPQNLEEIACVMESPKPFDLSLEANVGLLASENVPSLSSAKKIIMAGMEDQRADKLLLQIQSQGLRVPTDEILSFIDNSSSHAKSAGYDIHYKSLEGKGSNSGGTLGIFARVDLYSDPDL